MLRILLFLLALLAAGPTAFAQTSPTQPASNTTPNAPAPAQPAPAQPAPEPVPALSAAQAEQVLDVLRDNARRAQFIAVLESMAKVAPTLPPATATATTAAATPAGKHPAAAAPTATPGAPAGAKPGAAPAPAKAAVSPLAPDSLGAEILVGASDRLSALSTNLGETARAVTDFPLFGRWVMHLANDPDSRVELIETGWKLAVVMAAAIAVEKITKRLLRGTMRSLADNAPTGPRGDHSYTHPSGPDPVAPSAGAGARHVRRPSALTLLRRLPYVLGRFLLDLLPILAIATMGYVLLGTPLGVPTTTRLVILAVLNAYLLCRLVIAVTRLLVAPECPRLRLVHLSDSGARYILVWVRRIAVIAIFGYAIAEVALLFGLYRVAHDALLKLVALAVHISLIVVVLQCRGVVAEFIRGRADATGATAVLRKRAAGLWHIVAIFYLVSLWLVWAFDVPDGFSRLVRVFVSSIVILTIARLLNVIATGTLDRALHIDPLLAARYPGLEARARRYSPMLRLTISGIIAGLAVVALFQAWGLNSLAWFEDGALGGRVVSALVSIGFTLLLALLIWELSNASVQRRLSKLSSDTQGARSARMLTLLPMLRTVLLISICLVAALIILSEVGVNIAPLLAGAGVVGIAIGFGSQKLVQDVITGLFLLLENAMQVGDVVVLGGLTGSVENLSIRTIRLRALDGSVHIVPFSAVTTVTNMTRDYGYAVFDLSIGLNEEPDRITAVVREVAKAMRAEPRWAGSIRDDIEVMGIEKFVDLAFVLRARIMTLPGQRWAVARELNRRFKLRFDELAIESPITSFRALSHNPVVVPAVRPPEEASAA